VDAIAVRRYPVVGVDGEDDVRRGEENGKRCPKQDEPGTMIGNLSIALLVGADNLCHQAIFVDHATSAVTPPDPEMV
jgi:hypothetical protein